MIPHSVYSHDLSDLIETDKAISKEQAEKIFTFFQNCPAFRWSDANNDCEDRANAICIILDEWKIQNAKGWVFSGYVFKKTGFLKNLWKYHVAALLPVKEGEEINYYIIDPATSGNLIKLADWAAKVTDNPHSYCLVKKGYYYIFHSRNIERDNWYKRNKRNYNWTMQGLSGINGLSSKGKAQLAFKKNTVLNTTRRFRELIKLNPELI